jgi:head-tail adaptor
LTVIPAGERNRRISFERAIQSQSGMGREPGAELQPICRRWAKVLYGTGAERRAAGTESAIQAATFIVTDDSGTRLITVRDSIWFDERRWDVTSSAPIGGDRHFTAVTRKG